jgi:hypothetical protein
MGHGRTPVEFAAYAAFPAFAMVVPAGLGGRRGCRNV